MGRRRPATLAGSTNFTGSWRLHGPVRAPMPVIWGLGVLAHLCPSPRSASTSTPRLTTSESKAAPAARAEVGTSPL